MPLLHAIVLLFGLAACSHDATRENPLDPELTSAVTLTAVADDSTGTIGLSWTQTSGTRSHYLILRNAPRSTVVDTIARIDDPAVTTFDDTVSVDTEWLYRVSVVNTAGLETPSAEASPVPLTLSGVAIETLDFDSRTASARLRWTPYNGPRFARYEVQRLVVGETPLTVGILAEADVDSFVDSSLVGNKEYGYRVDVITDRGEIITGVGASGRFHTKVGEWPIDLNVGETVRLALQNGRIEALVASSSQVRLMSLSETGLHDGRVLFDNRPLPEPEGFADLLPRSASTTVDPDGRRLLTLATRNRMWVQAWSPEGDAERLRLELFDVALERADDELGNVGRALSVGNAGQATSNVMVDCVQVFSPDGPILNESFDAEPVDWTLLDTRNGLPTVFVDGWMIQLKGNTIDYDLLERFIAFSPLPDEVSVAMAFALTQGAIGGFDVDVTGGGFVSLWLNEVDNIVRLSAVAVSGFERTAEALAQYSVPLASQVRYVLEAELSGDRLSAALVAPYLWTLEEGRGVTWSSVGIVDGTVALTDGPIRYGLDPMGRVQAEGSPSEVSDMRQWPEGLMGLCLPDINQFMIGRASRSSFSGVLTWPQPSSSTTISVGSAGQGGGEFSFPLSLDRAPEGDRYYVLDAGNGRIQSFDLNGRYITQWGSKGDGDDQFDFGSGGVSTEFAGSIAVDDDGFIYVADVGNRRIQKFAP